MSQPSLRKSTRVRTIPKKYDDFVTSVAMITKNGEPSCYTKQMKVSKIAKWKLEMKVEMDALEKNKTWDLVELTKEIKVVGCKWVYKMKKGVDDKVAKHKARLVAKGYSKKEGNDFHKFLYQ